MKLLSLPRVQGVRTGDTRIVFRHGFAVNAVLSSVPPLVLRRWLGHASIDTTLIYTEVLAQDTKGYLDKMRF